MKKLALLLTLALPLSAALTSCGSGSTSAGTLPNYQSVKVGVSDGASGITDTRSIQVITPAVPATAYVPATATTPAIPATAGTPAVTQVVWSPSAASPAQITFRADAGSDAVTITGYRIISDTLGRLTNSTSSSLNIYVPSGYACANQTALASLNQSCDPSDATTKPATGITSTTLNIDLASDLIPLIESSQTTVHRTVDIEFTGVSSRNEAVTIVAKGVGATGTFAGTRS